MLDTQEEKIKHLIRKKGLGIDESIQKLGVSKQTFYNNIRKEPIANSFKTLFRQNLGINLDESLEKKENRTLDSELESLSMKLHDLSGLVVILKEERDALQNKLLLQHEKYQTLRDQYDELKAELDRLNNRTGTK